MDTWFFYPDDPSPSGGQPERLVMLHGRDPRWLVVNATTREIAGLLRESGGEEGAAVALAKRYGLDPEQARRDVGRVADELRRNGFLDDRAGAALQRAPVADSLFLHITHRCNFSCVHCYQASGHRGVDMPLESACRLFDEAATAGARGVTISGGEPLLHPEARALITHAADRMRVRLLTNGSLVDKDWAAFLAACGAQVQVSLDGVDPETHDAIREPGSHAAALEAVERLQQAGMGERVSFSATIMTTNLEQLTDIVDLAEQRGVPLVRFLPLGRRGRAEGNWDRIGAGVSVSDHESFYRLVAGKQRGSRCSVSVSCGLSGFLLEVTPEISPDGIWCPVGRTLVVDVDGSAYPCVLLMGNEFFLGNVIEQGLHACLEHPAMVAACAALVDRRQKIPACGACDWRNLCQAGCMGQALDHRGTIWERDDFCSYRQRAFGEAFDTILRHEADRRSPAGEEKR